MSLAVWMGGVTHELNRLRLASAGVTQLPSRHPSEVDVLKAWAAILRAAGRSVVVDIVAGTSAGGLNGSLLATAVAAGADMPDMKTAWLNLADLSALVDPPADGTELRSVLNGTYFTEAVMKLVNEITPTGGANDTTGEAPPSMQIASSDCTLLVTATAVAAPPAIVFLENGATSPTVDSRRVYRFDRRRAPREMSSGTPPERNDFGTANSRARDTLGLAARASASYPIAFEPVWESSELRARRLGTPSAGRNQSSRSTYIMDGGVLDNAPFGPLLEVLAERPVDRPFDRILLYVTPTIETVAPPSVVLDPPVGRVLRALLSVIREPDARLDRDALAKTFEMLSYTVSQPFRVISDYLNQSASNSRAAIPTAFEVRPYIAAAQNLFERYRQGRAEALQRQLDVMAGRTDGRLEVPPRSTLTVDAPGIPVSFDSTDSDRETSQRWSFGLASANRVMRWWARALADLAREQGVGGRAFLKIDESQRILNGLNELIDGRLRPPPFQTLSLAEQSGLLEAFYADTQVVTDLSEAMFAAAGAICEAFPGTTASELISVSKAVEVVSSLHSWSGGDYDTPTLRYYNVTPAVEPLVDIGSSGQADWPQVKLYGQRWGHFGAFARKSGREHDWLWGRLDGASALSALLLSEAGVAPETAQELRAQLSAAILASERKTPADVATSATEMWSLTANQLLCSMDNAERVCDGLQRNIQRVIGQLGADSWLAPGALMQTTLARKGDWTVKTRRYPLRGRFMRRLTRIYTAPIRWRVSREIKRRTAC